MKLGRRRRRSRRSSEPDVESAIDPADQQLVEKRLKEEGGAVTLDMVGRVLHCRHFADMLASTAFFELQLNRLAVANGAGSLSIHPTGSIGMATGISRISDRHTMILLPVGAMARAMIMHRLLLSYWDQPDPRINIVGSILDWPPVDRSIPTELIPLLRDSEDDEKWWDQLDRLDQLIALDEPRLEDDVAELNHLFLSMVLAHEAAHILRHHHDLQPMIDDGRLPRRLTTPGDPPPTPAELYRAIEVDADVVSTSIVLSTMLGQLAGHPKTDLGRGLMRLGYAMMAMYALYDPHRMALREYDSTSHYLHPTVRFQLVQSATADSAARFGVAEVFDEPFDYGCQRCFAALEGLELDIFAQRRFASTDSERRKCVIHALRITDASQPKIDKLAMQAQEEWLPLSDFIQNEYEPFKLRDSQR